MGCGFVYILVNEAMPGLVKIGKTKRMPTERSIELFTTGVPQPFVVKFALFTGDMNRLESDIHYELSDCRVSSSREFFRIGEDEAIKSLIGVFLMDFDSEIVYSDYVMDRGNLARYRHESGCYPPDVVQVIDMFTPEEWKSAYQRLLKKRESRKSKEAS